MHRAPSVTDYPDVHLNHWNTGKWGALTLYFLGNFQTNARNLVDIKKVKFGDCDLGDNCLNPVPDVCYTHDQRSQCGGPNATDEGWYDLQ